MELEKAIELSREESAQNLERQSHNLTAGVDDLVPYRNDHFLNLVSTLKDHLN